PGGGWRASRRSGPLLTTRGTVRGPLRTENRQREAEGAPLPFRAGDAHLTTVVLDDPTGEGQAHADAAGPAGAAEVGAEKRGEEARLIRRGDADAAIDDLHPQALLDGERAEPDDRVRILARVVQQVVDRAPQELGLRFDPGQRGRELDLELPIGELVPEAACGLLEQLGGIGGLQPSHPRLGGPTVGERLPRGDEHVLDEPLQLSQIVTDLIEAPDRKSTRL